MGKTEGKSTSEGEKSSVLFWLYRFELPVKHDVTMKSRQGVYESEGLGDVRGEDEALGAVK